MSNQELGVPIQDDAGDGAPPIRLADAKAAIEEIESCGVKVTKVHRVKADSPLRYYLSFPPELPMHLPRLALERKLYDVGQRMGDKELSFYASKRTTETQGWSD